MPNAFASYAYATEEYAGPPVPNSPYVGTAQGLFPFLLIEAAFGYGPNDANPVWTDITKDVTQFSTRRGRQHILGRFEAGTANLALDNKTGRYSPFNGTGPYTGNIKPGLPLRIRAIWGAVTYPVFSGYVESWPLTWPAANDSIVAVTAVDATKFLNLKRATSILTYSGAATADAPYLWYRCNDAAGSTNIADSGSAGLNLPIHYASGWPFSAGAPQAVYANPVFQSEGALVADTDASIDLGAGGTGFGGVFGGGLPSSIAANANFTVETWYQSNSGAGTSILGGISDNTGGGTFFYLVIDSAGNAAIDATGGRYSSTVPVNDGKWHHLVGVASGTSIVLYVDGIAALSTTKGSDSFAYTNVAVGGQTYGPDPSGMLQRTVGSLDEFAVYRATLSATQVATHYVAGTTPRYGETTGQRIGYLAGYTSIPASRWRIDTGQVAVQGATGDWLKSTILKNMQDQELTENGALFIDAAGNLTFLDRTYPARSPYSAVALVLGDSGTAPEEPYQLNSLSVPYDDQDISNEVVVTPAGLSPQIASDATSQTTYGKRTRGITILAASTADAAARAASDLALLKDSEPRIDSVMVHPADDPTMLFGPVLGFDLLTRLELKRRPMDGTGSVFDQVSLIEGIEHRVTKAVWETTWRLSSAGI